MILNASSTFTLVYIRLTVGVTIIHGQPCVSIIPHSERDRFKIMLAGVCAKLCMQRHSWMVFHDVFKPASSLSNLASEYTVYLLTSL